MENCSSEVAVAWDRLRVEFDPYAVGRSSRDAGVLRSAVAVAPVPDLLLSSVARNPACPLDLLWQAADAGMLTPLMNDSCPRELAEAVVLRALDDVPVALLGFLGRLPVDLLELCVGRMSVSDASLQAAAVSRQGGKFAAWLAGHDPLRVWLEVRDDELLRRVPVNLVRLIADRDDLSVSEMACVIVRLAASPTIRSWPTFLSRLPLTFELLPALRREALPAADADVIVVALALSLLRKGLDSDETTRLLGLLAADGLLERSAVPLLCAGRWDEGTLAVFAGLLPDRDPRVFGGLRQVVNGRPLSVLFADLLMLERPPAQLCDLSSSQLELVVQLGGRFSGRFGELLDVVVRAA